MNARRRLQSALSFLPSVTFLLSAALLLIAVLVTPRAALAARYAADCALGYALGPGGQVGLTVADFTRDASIRARFGLGYASVSPGDAEDAREIFINDATDGTPEKSGHVWSARFDFLVPVGKAPRSAWSVFGGPRYSRFTATFKYVGGNEDFDVRAHQWGFGGGVAGGWPMNDGVALQFRGGLDYFFKSELEGHDTAYSPDGQDVNPRKDFQFKDADKAINQPKLVAHCLAGVAMRL